MDATTIPQPRYLNLEYFFNKFFQLFTDAPEAILNFLTWISSLDIKLIANIAILVLTAGIIFVLYKIIEMRKKKLITYVDFFAEEGAPEIRTEKWQKIKAYMDSRSSSDWKMAIIEADSLIEEIMLRIGYEGKDLGTKLKSIEPSDFNNLQNVWEAHKVRNRIAHEGGKFELLKNEADIVIGKYERALRELKYI